MRPIARRTTGAGRPRIVFLRPSAPEKLNECQNADTTGAAGREGGGAAALLPPPLSSEEEEEAGDGVLWEEPCALRGAAMNSPPKQLAIWSNCKTYQKGLLSATTAKKRARRVED